MKNRTFAIGGLLALAAGASAQIVNVGPFTSKYSEGFEEFPYYNLSGPNLPVSSLSIMSTEATFSSGSGDQLYIYSPSNNAPFYVGPPVSVNVESGVNGLGVFNMYEIASATLTFDAPVNYLGGYFADYEDVPADVSFYDQNGVWEGSTTVGNGSNVLSWDGWYAVDPIKTVTFNYGLGTAMDNLVAGDTAQAVPEPAAMAVMGLGVLGLLLRRRK